MNEIDKQLTELERIAGRLSDAGARLFEIVQKTDRVNRDTFDPDVFRMLGAWLDVELAGARSDAAADQLTADFDRARHALLTELATSANELETERRAWITAMSAEFDRK